MEGQINLSCPGIRLCYHFQNYTVNFSKNYRRNQSLEIIIIITITEVMGEVDILVTIIDLHAIDTTLPMTEDMVTVKEIVTEAKESSHMSINIGDRNAKFRDKFGN